MRVLIVGGAGFIGSHVVDAFLENGIFPVVLDRNLERFRKPMDGVTYIRAELGNRGQIEAVISQGIDVVIHLVSSTLPHTSNDDPIFDVQMNLVESIALFEVCVRYKVKKVVFVSSGGTVYGIPRKLPISEEHPNFPICSYGIVKLAIEKYLEFYRHNFGLKYCVLRISNPYGIRQDPSAMQGAVAVFTSKILRNEPITIWGDGTVSRDYIAVRDVAMLCYLSAESSITGVFNVGSGQGVAINDLIKIISSSLGIEPIVNYGSARSFDVPEVVLDCSNARTAFNWRAEVKLRDGVSEYASWLKATFGLQ